MSAILAMRDFRVSAGGAQVLHIPALEIRPGEILALLGPNGAGKTTLIHSLAFLKRPAGGEISFKGRAVSRRTDLTALRRRMGVVFQEPFLMNTTVRRNVASGLAFRRAPDIDRKVARALELFGIPHLVERSARKLSGGEAARVCLARAFVLEPEVMMLDEPFSSLDPPTRLSLLDEVEEILRGTGVTTVMATHDSSEALRLADRIAVMNRGAIVQIGPTARIMTRPVDEFVAQFVGMETILEASVVSRSGRDLLVNVSGKELRARTDVQAGGKVLVCIRPQDVALHSSPPDGINVLGGTIVQVAPMLHHVKVTVDCGFTLCASVVRAPAGVDLAAGTPVAVSIDPSSLHVIGAPHPDA